MENNNLNNHGQKRAPVESGVIIKLGMDVHARQVTVCRQIGQATPQPTQRFSPDGLVGWVAKQVPTAAKVYSCYEAGPCGYVLHRRLVELGVENIVVAPRQLDGARRQKTDRLDARALLDQLDRYLGGNARALSVVRVPTVEQEQLRSQSRQRDQFSRLRRGIEARGRALLLTQGYYDEGKGPWWRPQRWEAIKPTLPDWIVERLTLWQPMAFQFDQQDRALRAKIEMGAPKGLPRGVGAMSWVILSREILDWSRFKNRRQVASYTGLCPGVHTSDGRGREGNINRCGNPRVRCALLELVWRLVRFQPDYRPVQLLRDKAALSPRRRRKVAVAAARHLAIDLWRLATGQTTAEKLGLNAVFTV
jgi:transposase